MDNSIKQYLKFALEKYFGYAIRFRDMEVCMDPKVAGCYAVQINAGEGEKYQCIVRDGSPEDELDVEEVEFTCWPPSSGNLKFFL